MMGEADAKLAASGPVHNSREQCEEHFVTCQRSMGPTGFVPRASGFCVTGGERPVVVLSYTRYRVRATLILFGLAGVGGVQLVQQVLLAPASGVLIEVARQGGGFLPMGVTQQVLPLAIVASALSSLLMGVAAGRGISAAPTAARGCPARVQPGE